jgi:nucleotide-binding universal stress UspA family protein
MTATTEITTPRRIVVGVDSSESAAHAAIWAAHEALSRNIPVHLVHAMDLPGAVGMTVEPVGYAQRRRSHANELLSTLADRLHAECPANGGAQLRVTTEVSELSAPETLVERSRDAELVVTGTRGHGGFAGLLLGSVSLKLAAHAHCPAVIVRGEHDGELLNEIVLGVEPEQDPAPVEFAFAAAAELGASVRAIRAWEPYAGYGIGYTVVDTVTTDADEARDAQTLIDTVAAKYPEVPVTVDGVQGNPVPTMIRASRNSRLIVVGAHRRRPPLSVGVGYVVQGLLSHADTPVAVVPIG